MLKRYIDRDKNPVQIVRTIKPDIENEEHLNNHSSTTTERDDQPSPKLQNSDIIRNLDSSLEHLTSQQKHSIKQIISEYSHLFQDIPSRTDKIYHDVDVGDCKPIKQHPYRLNPRKQEYLRKEVQYLLEHDFIEPSQSNWSSPCILVSKPDGSYRMCTDYRKINANSKTDTFPIPRIDDCIDRVGKARFVTKFDLLKGFYQIPLTDRAKEISAFVTPDGLYQYKVLPFGMKNSPPTFQRLINSVISGLEGCYAYIDDVILCSDSWDQHLLLIRKFFDRLSDAKLTINLVKSEFVKATVTFLGHIVGQGQVKPIEAKVEIINNFPRPNGKRQLMRYLGMVGYYRKFCPNFFLGFILYSFIISLNEFSYFFFIFNSLTINQIYILNSIS